MKFTYPGREVEAPRRDLVWCNLSGGRGAQTTMRLALCILRRFPAHLLRYGHGGGPGPSNSEHQKAACLQ
jgi:hypothetical protein